MFSPNSPKFALKMASRLQSFGCALITAAALSAQSAHGSWNSQYLDGDLNTTLGAYGTLGVTVSDSDKLGFRRDISSVSSAYQGEIEPFIDTQFNLQFSASYKNRLETTIQLKIRDQGLNDKLDDYIPIVFVTYRHSPTWSIRVGRLPIDVFMLSESRDVSYSYPWVRQITNSYGLFELDSYEGMDLNFSTHINDGFLQWRVSAGSFEAHLAPSEDELLRTEFENYYSSIVQFDKANWRLRASYMQADVEDFYFVYGEKLSVERFLKIAPTLNEATLRIFTEASPYEGTSVRQTALGASYENKRWQLQAEGTVTRIKDSEAFNFNSGYVSAAYRINKWTPYTAVARLQSSGRPSANAAFDPLTDEQRYALEPMGTLVSNNANHTSFIAGLRWDFRHNMALKLQWNRHRIGRHGAYLWHLKPGSNNERYVNTWSLNLDFII